MKLNASFIVVTPKSGEGFTVTLSTEVGSNWRDQQVAQTWLNSEARKLEAEFKNGERSFP